MSTCLAPEIIASIKERALKGEIKAEEILKMLPEEKQALRAILEDYVADKLGVSVSAGEVKVISEKAKKIDEAEKKLGGDLGNPAKVEENIEFFKAKKAMDDYLLSRHPSNRLKVLTGTIGRGMMLFSVKSPILNIGSNVELALTEALSRRAAGVQLKGADNKLAVDYVKMVNKVYQETGYDVSRMTQLSDTGAGGARVLGETTHSEGPGAVRKVGRVIEDIVFKQLMGAPDVAFSSAHFADSVNLNAAKFGEKGPEFMRDAMTLEPKTPEGEILRAQAIFDAQKATWTDKSWATTISEGTRKILNDVSGDARIGDFVLPFVKTPANVIATGMDYAGMGVPKALVKSYKAWKTGDLGTKAHFQAISRDLVRSGLGITGAVVLTQMLDDEDFVGAYDPKRAQIEGLRNSNYNAIRVGGKWISTDWLGPLSVPVTAMMYARKYGDTGGEGTFQYGKGVVASAMQIPGIADIYDTVKGSAFKSNQTLEEMTGATGDYITSQLYSRLVPSFISDTAKAIDPTVRVGGKGINGVIARIPFLSKTLPAKTNVFGEEVKGEPGWSDILFGARVKTDRENAMIREISRVSSATDNSIAFTDFAKSSSKTLAQFKAKVGEEKYRQAGVKYGAELKKQLEIALRDPRYKNLTDDQKLDILNKQDSQAMEKILKQYGFKYKAEKNVLPKI